MSGHALHPEAYADLDDIRGYIAQHNPDAADRVITEIFDAIDTDKEFEINVQDEKSPIVVLEKDPIANKYGVTRNLADDPA